MKIELYKGDITQLNTEAIVNAANKTLLGGGGVDGAIHKAAGEELYNECEKLKGCQVGEAKLTKGYNLKAKYVIHTVGPVWRDGMQNETIHLENCYKNSLKLAVENNIKTIAFPNISTGVYRFPKLLASKIAVRVVKKVIEENKSIEKVIFAIFDEENYTIYQELLNL
ncbi:MAG: O-acetyl-ADP-ribose deacetylase [Bacteroidetes bacterium GWA2_31_9]|nr:MAG: O-acetyl-ADP-ribose deacetylase [Bacteroidetes bacterium GWA2_31_9]